MIIVERLDAFKSDITFYFAKEKYQPSGHCCPSTMCQEGGESQ